MDTKNAIEDTVEDLRYFIVNEFKDDRARSLALTKLDECEMWLYRSVHVWETNDSGNT